jgi:hypothetical protein
VSHARRIGASRWLACLLGGVLACPAAAALDLHADTGALTPMQAARSRALLADADARLPGAWRDALDRVTIEWRDDLPPQVHGRALGDRVLLKRALLDAADDRPALAALLHELAHLYDRAGDRALSRDPRLRALAGWGDAPLRPWRTRNAFTDRSPDLYELDGPAEYLAVNLEHFLLDPDYACRRPALFRHLAEAVQGTPAHPACPATVPFLDAGADATSPLLALDPARVYAVDYLLAEGNDRPMSRWGHAMLRLVVCAPGHAPGPACRLDVDQHLVLSFRAFVDDVQVSSWRGLAGDYPSRLFVLPLAQVVDEYTRVELRGLRSIPLALQPPEIVSLLQRAAQLHWSYDGRYRFIGNNCAVETARLLQEGVPRLADASLMRVTPNGLLRRLVRTGVADPGVLADRDAALRHGYYFESMAARYQALFDIARPGLADAPRRVQDWLALPPGNRARAFAATDLRSAAALLLLEEAALRRLQLEARDLLKRRPDLLPAGDADGVIALEGLLTHPSALLHGEGYGLPQPAELAALAPVADALAAKLRGQRADLLATARARLPTETRDALAGTEANLARLGERLRALNAAEGGLQLE